MDALVIRPRSHEQSDMAGVAANSGAALLRHLAIRPTSVGFSSTRTAASIAFETRRMRSEPLLGCRLWRAIRPRKVAGVCVLLPPVVSSSSSSRFVTSLQLWGSDTRRSCASRTARSSGIFNLCPQLRMKLRDVSKQLFRKQWTRR